MQLTGYIRRRDNDGERLFFAFFIRVEKTVLLGASPRAMIAFVKVAMGFAALEGRDHLLPDDLKVAAVPVLAHRIIFRDSFTHRGDQGKSLVKRILEALPVPSEHIDFSKRK